MPENEKTLGELTVEELRDRKTEQLRWVESISDPVFCRELGDADDIKDIMRSVKDLDAELIGRGERP